MPPRGRELSVAVWNVFLDHEYPQQDRFASLRDTIAQLSPQPDLMGILEADLGLSHDFSQELPAVWAPHSRRRLNEGIGVYGAGFDPDSVEPLDIGHNKIAIKVAMGRTAIVFVHLKRAPKIFDLSDQCAQAEVLLDATQLYDRVAILGDLNVSPHQAPSSPRRMLRQAGFRSVFTARGVERPLFPSKTMRDDEGYWGRLSHSQQLGLRAIGHLVTLDDCYIRGAALSVSDETVVYGASDHPLLQLTLRGVL